MPDLYEQATEGYEVLFAAVVPDPAEPPFDPPFDATDAELAAEDRAYASGCDADFAADREWGRRGFLS